jgi:hypothetical protein
VLTFFAVLLISAQGKKTKLKVALMSEANQISLPVGENARRAIVRFDARRASGFSPFMERTRHRRDREVAA